MDDRLQDTCASDRDRRLTRVPSRHPGWVFGYRDHVGSRRWVLADAQLAATRSFRTGPSPVPVVRVSPDLTAMSADTATKLRAVTDEDAAVIARLRQHATSPF